MHFAPVFLTRSRGVLRSALFNFVLATASCRDESESLPTDAAIVLDANVSIDVATADADVPDADVPDADVPDADVPDTRWPAAFEWQGQAPVLLSQTGLFANTATKQISPYMHEFSPAFPLWTDAAEKRRWVWLPPGTKIDTSEMDHWRFPVGTRFFKEFARDGKRLETRMIVRTGEGTMDYFMAAYVWDEQEQEAALSIDGASNVRGTDHDVPKAKDCWACHGGDKGRVLGFSSMQLAGQGTGLRLDGLIDRHLLSTQPSATALLGVPGEGIVRNAIGYMHGNCGHCHSDIGIARPETEMVLRLYEEERDPLKTRLYATSIGKALFKYRRPGFSLRVDPGHPETSALLYRLASRQRLDAMPPLGTKHIDDAGVAIVTEWIRSLAAPLP